MTALRKHLRAAVTACAALLVLLGCACALADPAYDMTDECKLDACYSAKKADNAADRKYSTAWRSRKVAEPWLEITSPGGMPVCGVYVCFAEIPESWEVRAEKNGAWETVAQGCTDFLHAYVEIPGGAPRVRIVSTAEGKTEMAVSEIYALSAGDVPDWVQRWEKTPEKLDVLFVTAHAGDAALYFGGAVPEYAAEQGRAAAVAVLASAGKPQQKSEMLDSLWTLGLRTYPILGNFRQTEDRKAAKAYASAGRDKVMNWIVRLYRTYRPEAVVTLSEDSENGLGQHGMTADACIAAFDAAATEGEYLETFDLGVWQVKKLYTHNGAEGPLALDWNAPLASMGGKTGMELARDAWAKIASQKKKGYAVEADSGVFGLTRTAVGADERGDDLLEHIYASKSSFTEAAAAPAPAPTATPAPEYLSVMPELNEAGYLDEGEFVHADDTNGLYIYVSQTLKVVIRRLEDKTDSKHPLTWFDAEVWCDVAAGELPQTLQYDREKMGKARTDAAENALKHQTVLATNTDYYTYRIGSKGSRHIGTEIRDGVLLYDDRWPAATAFFPNLDTLSFYPDGSLRVNRSYELSGQDYLDQGAYMVYSFGPYLIRDGSFSEEVFTHNSSRNPRFAVGMVEPGHYVLILCEGRLKRSSGVTMKHLAMLMKERGCKVAMNLDGGQTAVMVFMGKQLNRIGVYDGKTSARPTSEILAFGASSLVGQTEFK